MLQRIAEILFGFRNTDNRQQDDERAETGGRKLFRVISKLGFGKQDDTRFELGSEVAPRVEALSQNELDGIVAGGSPKKQTITKPESTPNL